ncbi:hypothetical protein LY474_34970 [Myxococcus stipitatus]|uniref:hypothetical protein n=1 Tax=Myxococcus stipitatus TaxID=83455 RepID=UPI001F1D4B82|nr:hypothetical protein [Myxococcus stipitatus]MCE9673022.1 hypothetical protein [Myxococcus stipitatus]
MSDLSWGEDMKIDDDHIYHGAALTQIAEHPQFTAINVFKGPKGNSRSAFKINDDIGVYLKYATAPKKSHSEYQFSFRQEHLDELRAISARVSRVFVALVCVEGKEICCLNLDELMALIDCRRQAKGTSEEQYTILLQLPHRGRFRAYVNAPGRKNLKQGKNLIIPRSDFPAKLFGE